MKNFIAFIMGLATIASAIFAAVFTVGFGIWGAIWALNKIFGA